MSESANVRKNETSVKSFINTIKSRFGLVQHQKETAIDTKRLESLLSAVDQEVRFEAVTMAESVTSTQQMRAEDTVMQEQWALNEMKIVNLAIERKYEELRSTSLDDREERLCVEAIQKLEMRRLNLMTILHGQDINGYAAAR